MTQTSSFWSDFAEDLIANNLLQREAGWTRPGIVKKILWVLIFHPNVACIFWYRVNRHLALRKLPFKDFLSARRIRWFGNDISYYADIGPGLVLGHISDIVIGKHARIGKNAVILNGVTIGAKKFGGDPGKQTIGDNVKIGTGAKILGTLSIGDNAMVGALTLVDSDVPENNVVYGIPPNRIIRPL